MGKELFVRAEEVARELGISKPYAYKPVSYTHLPGGSGGTPGSEAPGLRFHS